jgi:serine/threonine-protein kinase HipA
VTVRRALVRLAGEPVGALLEDEHGCEFRFLPSWLARAEATPIALTLPLREQGYRRKALHPYFENLLPEGWLLELSTAKLKIQKDDAFGLLLATCADCIGAVEIVPWPAEGVP